MPHYLGRQPAGINRFRKPMTFLPPKMRTSLRLIIAAIGLAVFSASAQTPAGLDIQLYARLSITDAVGTVYSVEYVTDLAQTNNASAWRR